MTFLATLPMYDWPETQAANDKLWNALSSNLQEHGLEAPNNLSRNSEPMGIWQNPNLVLGQTCGLPYVNLLAPNVTLVGTPAYDIECGAGSYYSVIIVRQDSDIYCLEDLAGKKFGFNNLMSQSGYAAFLYHLQSSRIPIPPLAAHHLTGSHRQSVKAVASVHIDVAAIDAVTWALAERHEAASSNIRILDCTAPTPGLPLITAIYRDKKSLNKLQETVVEAMASLTETVRDELLLMGFAPTTDDDYLMIKERYASLELST